MHLPHHLSRHRKFQIGITIGVTSGALIGLCWPHLATHATTIGLIANAAWIWEQ